MERYTFIEDPEKEIIELIIPKSKMIECQSNDTINNPRIEEIGILSDRRRRDEIPPWSTPCSHR